MGPSLLNWCGRPWELGDPIPGGPVIPRYEPMLATSWRAPFSDDEWFFEPKWDGYRLIVSFDGVATSLRSRAGSDLTSRYPELAQARFDRPSVFDGEVVVFGENGQPSFEQLQQRSGHYSAAVAASYPVAFIVFDFLWDGTALVDSPMSERRHRLGDVDLPDGFILSTGVIGAGRELWGTVLAEDLEGMVAKRLASRYVPGVRSPDWRKIPHVNLTRVVVGGFTHGEGGRSSTLGALLVGQWDGSSLRFCGSVGTGFSNSGLRAIRDALDQQIRDSSPFEGETPSGAVFVEPVLVAVVGYRNWTEAGRLRHPSFRGFSNDPPDAYGEGLR
jgi:bifunctional non-homologous end joining protein LigD